MLCDDCLVVWRGSFQVVSVITTVGPRHIGWEKSCHGLTCRPKESSGEGVLCDLSCLLGDPGGSGAAF